MADQPQQDHDGASTAQSSAVSEKSISHFDRDSSAASFNNSPKSDASGFSLKSEVIQKIREALDEGGAR